MPPRTLNTDGSPAQAEETAAAVLGWLAGEPDMFARFLALTGVTPDQIRSVIAEPGFMAGMIEFIMSHEPTLLQFCEATGTRPEAVVAASVHYGGRHLDSGEY